MKKLISLLLTAAMLASFTLTGCGSGSTETTTAEGGQTTEETTQEETSSDDKKVFVYPADQDVSSLLPSSGGSDSVAVMFKPLYDPLFVVTNEGYHYYLVDNLEESEDGLTIKLHFNENAKWHDGEPVTVNDFLFTLKYYTEGATRANTTLTKVNGEEVIYEKTSDYDITITLPSNRSSFITSLGRTYIYPAHVFGNDPNAVEGSDEAMLGIGNGPFKLKEWNKGENIIYEKNPDYYRGEAKIDELIMKIIPDASAKEVALQSGEVSCMRISSKEKYEKYKNDENYSIFSTPECRVNYLVCNPMSSKITTKEQREALFTSINLQEIMDTVYGSEEMSKAATSIFCDQSLYYNTEMSNYEYDLEKAKQMVKDSGLEGETLTYIYNNQRVGMPEVAIVIQQQLKEVGINVELQAMDSSSFMSEFFSWMSEPSAGWDLGTNGWDSLQGDPSSTINTSLENPNATACSQETVDTFHAAIYGKTQQEIEDNFWKLQELVKEDYTIYPISCPNYVWVAQKGVSGLDTINSMVPFEDWTLIDVA